MPYYNKYSEVAINVIPHKYGQKKDGVQNGPSFLLDHDLIRKISSLNLQASTCTIESAIEDQNISNLEKCSHICQLISNKIVEQVKQNKFILNLGGDHSIATGTLSGMLRAYPNLCVVWIDAHLDINTPATSPSGNVHGMPVSFVMNDPREEAKSAHPKEYEWCKENLIEPCKIAYIGTRQADLGEIKTVQDLNITVFDMVAIEKYGIDSCITSAIKKIDPDGKNPIHVSFDVDGVDPMHIPSTGTPVKGGLSIREILHVAEFVNQTGRLVGLDVVEFNPSLKKNDSDAIKSAKFTNSIIKSFLGKRRPQFSQEP